MTEQPAKLYHLSVTPNGCDVAGLHDVLLRHPDIRAVHSFMGFQFWIKSERSAQEIGRLVAPYLPGVFTIAECVFENTGGRLLADDDWFTAPLPPPRAEDHDPRSRGELRTIPLEMLVQAQRQGMLEVMPAAGAA